MEIKTHRVLSSATTVEEWLEILADEVDILNEPEQTTVGEVYTLLTHRDELQSRLQDTEGSEAIQQRVEEIDRRLLEKAEVIADAEDLPHHREQRSRAEGVRVFAWWWHLDEAV
jgi:chromosome condensin MukBEF ATPase and DNA-binding subunit MukB